MGQIDFLGHLANLMGRSYQNGLFRLSTPGGVPMSAVYFSRRSKVLLGLASAFVYTNTSYAIVSENTFSYEAESHTTLAGSDYFVPKHTLRPSGEAMLAPLDATFSITELQQDRLDQSLLFIRGSLPINLNDLFKNGSSLQAWIATSPDADLTRQIARHIAREVATQVESQEILQQPGVQLVLNEEKTLLGEEFSSISFDLQLDNRIVYGASLSARFKWGQWISLQSESLGATTTDRTTRLQLPRITASQKTLAEIARKKLGPAYGDLMQVDSIYFPQETQSGYALTPAKIGSLRDNQGQLYTLIVSETDGSILEFSAHRYNFSGKISGSYYNRHPESGTVTTGLPFVSVRTGGVFRRKTFTADENGFLEVPGEDEVSIKLISPFVSVSNSAGTDANLTATGDVTFVPERDASLAETTTFFHTTVVNMWAREVLDNRLKWLDEQLTATVNINSTCNAYYNGTINFFNAGSRSGRDGSPMSCNNTGEIADVVYHEWGHGLDDNTGGIQDGAFSEGIGDIVSMLITNSPEVGPYFLTNGKPVRNMDGEYQYPPAQDMREVHKEGLIIGATWYHMTQDLISKYGNEVGRDLARSWFLQSIYSAAKYTQQYEVLVDLDAEENGAFGPNYCLINAAFARHGLAKVDEDTCSQT